MENVVTVNYLLNLLQRVSDYGWGDAKVKCQDGYLHEDEIALTQKELKLRGHLFNYSPSEKVKEFGDDIDKAIRKFYMLEE